MYLYLFEPILVDLDDYLLSVIYVNLSVLEFPFPIGNRVLQTTLRRIFEIRDTRS